MKNIVVSAVCLAVGAAITFGAMEFLANDMMSQTMAYSKSDRMDMNALVQSVNVSSKSNSENVIAIYEVTN